MKYKYYLAPTYPDFECNIRNACSVCGRLCIVYNFKTNLFSVFNNDKKFCDYFCDKCIETLENNDADWACGLWKAVNCEDL